LFDLASSADAVDVYQGNEWQCEREYDQPVATLRGRLNAPAANSTVDTLESSVNVAGSGSSLLLNFTTGSSGQHDGYGGFIADFSCQLPDEDDDEDEEEYPTSSPHFTVTSGSCTTSMTDKLTFRTESCVRSPNFPAEYGNDESCTIVLSSAATVSSYDFDTRYYDYLSIDGRAFSGSGQDYAPFKVPVVAGSTIGWYTAGYGTSGGFELCVDSGSYR
jgi:hypothetical protein